MEAAVQAVHSQALAQATTFAPRVRTCTLHTRNEDDYAELLRRGCRSRARRRQSAGSPRETAMKLSRGVARFNKRVTKRIQGLYAWLVPPWAVILHRGRRSARSARTAGSQRNWRCSTWRNSFPALGAAAASASPRDAFH